MGPIIALWEDVDARVVTPVLADADSTTEGSVCIQVFVKVKPVRYPDNGTVTARGFGDSLPIFVVGNFELINACIVLGHACPYCVRHSCSTYIHATTFNIEPVCRSCATWCP